MDRAEPHILQIPDSPYSVNPIAELHPKRGRSLLSTILEDYDTPLFNYLELAGLIVRSTWLSGVEVYLRSDMPALKEQRFEKADEQHNKKEGEHEKGCCCTYDGVGNSSQLVTSQRRRAH